MSLIVRPTPERTPAGHPDPRVLGLWLDEARRPPVPPPRTVDDIRATMGWDNRDLSTTVESRSLFLKGKDNRSIPARLYRPSGDSLRPVVVYFHGGGFFGGSLKTVENPCRYLAERASALVVSVDYRLAPEHPFPAGLDDAFDAVLAVKALCREWNGDPTRLVVAGDSAGGNLAAACCIRDRSSGNRDIAAQLLIYPSVDLRISEHLPWSEDEYDVRAWPELVWKSIQGLRKGAPAVSAQYLQGHPDDDPEVSPLLYSRPQDFPPTLVVTAEYDCLRVEGEAFARQLSEAGVRVRTVRFQGMDHAFFDKLGFFPQAAEVVDEMAAFVRSLGPRTTTAGDRLRRQFAFLLEADKLKTVLRRNELSDGSRRENTAEHSWHLVLFALTLAEYADTKVDVARVVKLCAVHDLVEIDAGDTFFYDDQGNQDKAAREAAAADRIFGLLPADQGLDLRRAWEEFEAAETPEARLANAVDRLAPVLMNATSGGRSWKENGVTARKVLDRIKAVGRASTVLNQAFREVVASAVKEGFLEP